MCLIVLISLKTLSPYYFLPPPSFPLCPFINRGWRERASQIRKGLFFKEDSHCLHWVFRAHGGRGRSVCRPVFWKTLDLKSSYAIMFKISLSSPRRRLRLV